MAKKAERHQEYALDMYVDEELDIESILSYDKPEYHYEDGKMTLVEKGYYSRDEVMSRTSDFNKNHKSGNKFDTEARKKLSRRNRKRTLQTIFAVSLIVLVGIFFALVLYPQAELSELSRDNSDKKDEISELKKEILDAKGESNGVTDMDSIRAQAMALGMQDPNANQIVNIPMPGSDRLVSVAAGDSDRVDTNEVEAARKKLMEYYHDKGSENN